MVNSGDVLNSRVSPSVSFRVAAELHKKYGRSTLRGGEILVTLVGANFGQVAIAPSQYAGHNCARPVGIVPVMESARYVMYALQSPLLRQRMDNVANTTAQPTLNLKDLGQLPIPVPPKATRDDLADFLGKIDDRIAILRKTNSTLEAIAQALFKSWFVDFDPVRAKRDGRAPDGMDEATAALFPDSFEDSELGEVPRGWAVRLFADTVHVFGGGTPKTSIDAYWGGDIPWFSVVDAPDLADVFVLRTEKSITSEGLKNSSTRLLPIGTTIISARGTVGRLALTGCAMAMNQSCYGLRGKAGDTFMTYYSTKRLVDALRQRAHGSVFDTITRETLAGVQVVLPASAAINAFEDLAGPIMERIRANLAQAHSLTALRDTLLPRLISGQLRLPAASEAIEQALA